MTNEQNNANSASGKDAGKDINYSFNPDIVLLAVEKNFNLGLEMGKQLGLSNEKILEGLSGVFKLMKINFEKNKTEENAFALMVAGVTYQRMYLYVRDGE